ncbi:LptF/LptG family permease [Crateriforma conspicua]|uniref:Putative permease YjgP/YjgQ family protein n=1 Tax=Crateriforma conspicua TaxID=2527996 RepID=A0A5C5Y911_9PLAN|nr:LptF/LptG family permease [Crateriforma conspicua]QDV64455.1 putative permease YjgP/YjgQ family protein [Crateriforma conspicua]TWT69852.1 putative permease YjgP/YjgQ family protein [Crateriforma conspicua]
MPSRLTRYILAEIFKIFVIALVVLTVLLLLIVVARELLRKGLGPDAVLRIMPFMAPVALQFALPATALFSVCCVYGRMASDGEIATVKASGISPMKLLQPAIIFAALLSPVSVALSDVAKSWGQPGLRRVVMMSIEDIAYRLLRSKHSYQSDHGFSIHVREVVGHRLIHPAVTIRKSSGGPVHKLTAAEGELILDPETMSLIIKLVDSQLEFGSHVSGTFPGEHEWPIELQKGGGNRDPSSMRPQDLPLRLIGRERLRQDSAMHETVGKLAAQTAFSILTARPEELAGPQGQAIEWELSSGQQRLILLHTEPWRRWAEGFTCLFFVLVGAPLAMIAKSSDYWSTFGMCFLPTILIYFPLFLLGLEQAKDGHVPPWGVWVGNFVLGGISVILMARVRRY